MSHSLIRISVCLVCLHVPNALVKLSARTVYQGTTCSSAPTHARWDVIRVMATTSLHLASLRYVKSAKFYTAPTVLALPVWPVRRARCSCRESAYLHVILAHIIVMECACLVIVAV